MPTIQCIQNQGFILKKPIDPNYIIDFGYIEECVIWAVQDENKICFVHQHILSDPQKILLFIEKNFSGLPNIDIKLYGGLYTAGDMSFNQKLLVGIPSSIMKMRDKEFPSDYSVALEQESKLQNGTMNTAQHNRMNANFILHFLQKHVESSRVEYESFNLSEDPNTRGNIIYRGNNFEEGFPPVAEVLEEEFFEEEFPMVADVHIQIETQNFEHRYNIFDIKPSTHMRALHGREIEQDLAKGSKCSGCAIL